MLDPVLLSRLQFGATASFHIIFPSLIIGLALYLSAMELCWLRTGKPCYREQYQFWLRPFAAVFVLGAATGVVLSYQLDTVFGGLYRMTGPVLMPVREAEFISTMLIASGGFGVMVGGWQRAGRRLHCLATLAVASGVLLSTACVLIRNSWMQTPVGAQLVDGTLVPTGASLAMLVSPSFPYRYVHVLGGACLSTAFFVLGISAWYLLRRRHLEFAACGFRIAMGVICVAAPLQIVSGDAHGLNTLRYQPLKIAAIEALWDSRQGAPLVLAALPDMEQERNRYALEIPRLASLVLTHHADGALTGLKSVPRALRPHVPLVFYSFRIMVATGLLMLLPPLLWLGWLRRRPAPAPPWFLWSCVLMLPSGLVATVAGWCVTEAGRQPWAVYGLVKTVDIIDAQGAAQTGHLIVAIGLAYVAIALLTLALLGRTVRRGPAVAPA